tara:strand:+ start:176 stop:469 length:294 start_codon:yes stop_codon:yes gene_type:complete
MIIFVSMNGCGFCTKAKQALATEIMNNEVKVMSPEEALESNYFSKSDLQAFPTFLNVKNNKIEKGFRSKDHLFSALEYKKEKFSVTKEKLPSGIGVL